MPLLRTGRPVDYSVEFVPPSTAESDFAWDNFQDQIVVHSKLGKLVVVLNATKQKQPYDIDASGSSGGECAFHPRTLPTVRAPALKLFDYIERTNATKLLTPEAGTAALHRNEMRVSESFNGARRTPTQTLEPLPSITAPASRPSSRDLDRSGRRVATPNQPPPGQAEKAIAHPVLQPGVAEISSLKEARAVISQLRAQHLTLHRGAMSGAASSTARATMVTSVRVADDDSMDETSPEAHLQTAKRELDAFNNVVATAKQRVASETAAAKSELCYYEQFLPKATASKPATPPVGTALVLSGSSSSSLSTVVVDKSSSNQPKAQRVAKKQAPGKLPSLSADCSTTASKAENNQELSPRKNGSPAQRVTAEKALTERKRTPLTARRPLEVPPQQQQQQQRANAVTKGTAASSKAASSGRTTVRSLSAAKKPVGVQSKGRERDPPTRRQQAEDESDQLSDFDDADPEIDAAPDLPEELTGVAALENDSDMDSDGF